MKRKVFLVFVTIFSTPLFAEDPMVKSMEYLGNDKYGNKIYTEDDFIFIDAGKNDGKFVSISIATLLETKEAGFSITAAKSFGEMNRNNQAGFNQVYEVDCEKRLITDERNRSVDVDNMQGVYRTAVDLACESIESLKE